jgi:hypothetical protein
VVFILHRHKAASVLHSISNCLFDRCSPQKTTPFPCFHSLQQQRSTKVSNWVCGTWAGHDSSSSVAVLILSGSSNCNVSVVKELNGRVHDHVDVGMSKCSSNSSRKTYQEAGVPANATRSPPAVMPFPCLVSTEGPCGEAQRNLWKT